MHLAPITLRGDVVELAPLEATDVDAAVAAMLSAPEMFRFIPLRIRDAADARAALAWARKQRDAGTAMTWVTRLRATGAVVGSTSFLAVEPAHRRLEIGFTWLVPQAQRTAANTEAKYLQLRYAFEQLGCLRVELKTDARNARSRAAIARIGATEEGTLRSHMLCWDGHRRDSVYFSVIDTEWPAVKAGLEARLRDDAPQEPRRQ